MSSSFPVVRPTDQGSPCEFMFSVLKTGKVTPSCQKGARVQLDFGERGRAWNEKTFALLRSSGVEIQQETQHLCIDHAIVVLADRLLEKMGTPWEFGINTPGSLKIFLGMWLKRQLAKPESKAVPVQGPH